MCRWLLRLYPQDWRARYEDEKLRSRRVPGRDFDSPFGLQTLTPLRNEVIRAAAEQARCLYPEDDAQTCEGGRHRENAPRGANRKTGYGAKQHEHSRRAVRRAS